MKIRLRRRKLIRFCIILIITAAIGCAVNNYLQYNVFYPQEYYRTVTENAEKYDIDPLLIMSLIKAESGFISDARSHKNAIGLMQVTPDTAQWCAAKMKLEDYSAEQLGDPETNIAIGVWYLDYLSGCYDGDIQLALAAYNAGIGNVNRWIKNGETSENGGVLTVPYEETSNYLIKINSYYERYRQLYKTEGKKWTRYI